MTENDAREILSDLRSLITCAICQEQLTHPKLLPCQHSFCLRCLKLLLNAQNGDVMSSHQVSCPSCRQIAPLTPGGADVLPTDIRTNQIVAIVKNHESRLDVKTDVAVVLSVFDITDSDSDLDVESSEQRATFLWRETSTEHVWDVDFMNDGSVLCATSCRLRLLSTLEGCDMHLPFEAGFLNSPCAVSANSETVVIADWYKGNNESFLVVMKKGGSGWKNWNTVMKKVPFQPNGIALLPDGGFIMSGNDHVKDNDLLLRYDVTGSVVWCRSFPSDTLGPYIAADSTEKLFISTPTRNCIDVYSTSGEHVSKFQAEGVHEPRGLCFSSEGHLVVADQATRKVSMFDMKGALVEELVQLPGLPNSVCLHDDKLLAVTDWQEKSIYMYEINK